MATQPSKGIILIVDDEAPIRDSLGELLTACGFEVTTADCVDAAAAVLEKRSDIEAILSDLKMPVKSGIELLRHINKIKRNVPVTFLTGYGTLETCQEAVREGAFDYILKPIDDKDKVIFPLTHAVEKFRLEKRNQQLQQEIIRLAEEHQQIIAEILDDAEVKAKVWDRVSKVLDKWKT
jgi:DNA-binding NtrC family response regulator